MPSKTPPPPDTNYATGQKEYLTPIYNMIQE